MPFYRLGKPGEDTIAHLNFGRGRGSEPCRRPRFPEDNPKVGEVCGRMSIALCDSKGCDIPICALHRTKHPTKPNTDYCSDHKEQAK